MRPIKFRGKRIDNGEWVYGLLIRKYCCGTEWHQYWGIQPEKQGEEFEVDPATVGQFTGLTDKNGKEIYEGDIIAQKECGYKNRFHREGVIEYKDSGFIVKGDDESYDYLKTQYRFLEVIGNIHDNPELLKTGEPK